MTNKIKLDNYKICHKCGGKMPPTTVSESFKAHGKEITLKGLNAYRCESCEEIIFPAEEIKKIDKVVRTFFSTFVYGGN